MGVRSYGSGKKKDIRLQRGKNSAKSHQEGKEKRQDGEEAGLHRRSGDRLDRPPKSNAGRQRWYSGKPRAFGGSCPAWTCSSSSFLCPVPGQAVPHASWCRGHREQPARAPRPSQAGNRAPGDHRGTPDASGAAGEAEQIPLLAPSQPSRGDSPTAPVPPRGNNGSPGFTTRSQRDVPSWHPPPLPPLPPQEPAVLRGLGSSLPCPCQDRSTAAGSPPGPGQEPDRDFPCGSSRWYLGSQSCTPPPGFFCGDIFMSPCHLVPTRSRGGTHTHAPRALCGAFCKTHAFGVFSSLQPVSFPSKRAPPGCCVVAQGCALL